MLHCKICLVDPICKIGCDKLKDSTINDLIDKIITRLLNSNIEITLTKGDIKVFIEGGVCSWWKNGELHREDGPAVEDSDGYKAWYKNGEFHRDDGPAVEYSDGTKEWYKNGKRHREDGPAIEWSDGFKERINNTKP